MVVDSVVMSYKQGCRKYQGTRRWANHKEPAQVRLSLFPTNPHSEILCEMLHQPKPRPPVHPPQQAHHGFQETLDLLVDQSVAICRRLTAQKEAAASPDSPVSTLLREQTKALQESVYCLPTRLLHANLTPGADVPPDIKAQLRTVQQDVFKFLSLDGFYARNPENGRVGGLNALFASKFILENHGATGLTCPSLGPDGAQQILTRLQKIMEAIGPDLS